jgi:hypothetical protein
MLPDDERGMMNSIHNILVSIHEYIYPRSKQKSKELKLFEIEYANICEECKRDLGFKNKNIIELSDEAMEFSSVGEVASRIDNKFELKFQFDDYDFSDKDTI